MATQFREEEENPFANFDFDSVQLEENANPFADFDFSAAGFGGDSDSLGFSLDRAMLLLWVLLCLDLH